MAPSQPQNQTAQQAAFGECLLGDQPIGEEARQAIGGAAQQAVEQAAGPPPAVPDEP